MFHERDTFDLKVHFVGVIAWFGLLVCVFAFVVVFVFIISMVCQTMPAPTAHFPFADLRSGVLFCLNESFRINLFPKTPPQTQKRAIIVAKSCRRSSISTRGFRTEGRNVGCTPKWFEVLSVCVWFTHPWPSLCIYNLSTPCDLQSGYHSRRALSSVVQFKPLFRCPANQKRTFPKPFCPSRAREIHGGCDFRGQRWPADAGHWSFAWAVASRQQITGVYGSIESIANLTTQTCRWAVKETVHTEHRSWSSRLNLKLFYN